MASFKNNSRYFKAIVSYAEDDRLFVRTRKPLYFNEGSGDSFITVLEEYLTRSDLLSLEAYGRDDLAWVIFDTNNIFDPTEDLVIGKQLRIPSLDKVLAYLE